MFYVSMCLKKTTPKPCYLEMDDLTKYELIESYLANEMSADDRRQFEKQLEENTALKEELKLHEQMADVLKGEKIHQFRDVLKEVDKEWKKPTEKKGEGKIVRMNFRRVLAIAASLALLIIAWQFFFSNSNELNSDKLFADHFEPYQMILNQRSTSDDTHESTALLNTGIKQYAAGDFAGSSIAFRQLMDAELSNISFQFYYALSLLGNNEPNNAIPVLEKIMDTPEHLFLEQSRWYLALAYLQNNEKEKAVNILHKIKEGEYKFLEKEKLIQRLEGGN